MLGIHTQILYIVKYIKQRKTLAKELTLFSSYAKIKVKWTYNIIQSWYQANNCSK